MAAPIHDLATGRETSLDTGTLSAATLVVGAGNTVIFAAAPGGTGPTQIHFVGAARPSTAMTTDPNEKIIGAINSTGTALLFTTRVPGAGRGGRGGGAVALGDGGGARPALPAVTARVGRGVPRRQRPTFSVLSIPDGKIATITGSSPSFSPDGSTIVFVAAHRGRRPA